MIRIISGERRGAKIVTPDGDTTRPLRDRVREALFNTLRGELRGATVLDAFAGSGAVGFEALSNGASRATFVESDKAALAVIRANAQKLRYENQSTILEGTSPRVIATAPKAERYSLLFLMPPYHSRLCEAVLNDEQVLQRVTSDALAVCEVHKEEPFALPDRWQVTKEKLYGITRLIFLARKAS